jgi:hypothetical protein
MRRLAAAGILAAVAMGACSDDDSGRPDPADQPGDDVISATLDELWSASGVDVSQVSTSDYRWRFEPNTRGCADLPIDDRWLGVRTSSAPPGLGEQQALEASISGYLEDDGFTVEHFRSAHPDGSTRALDAVSDDMRVYVYLSADGFTDVTVQAGPCAPTFGGIGEQFEPDA